MEQNEKSIQWFPGHMAKTRRLMRESLSLIDLVIEVADARIPQSSRNPEIDRIIGTKPRLLLLNKSDCADETATGAWLSWYAARGIRAVACDCRSGKGVGKVPPAVKEILAGRLAKLEQKGMSGRPVRLMAAGIPNVGKSSLINRLAGAKRAKVEDRPGVTRGRQWVKLSNGMELLDMPGVLWPKFEDKAAGRKLAYTGAVRDAILDVQELGAGLARLLSERYPLLLAARYGLEAAKAESGDGWAILEAVGRKRGMLIAGGEVDAERAAVMLLDEFRGGKIGRMTLETPQKREGVGAADRQTAPGGEKTEPESGGAEDGGKRTV